MLMRFDPFRDLDRLTQQVWGGGSIRPSAMAMDAYRHGDHVVAHFDLPGIAADSVELTVEENVLTVSAKREWQPEEGSEVLVAERPQGSFSRQLFLGDSLDVEHVEAHYDSGVLTVTIPVAEAAKPRRVEITTGASGREIRAGQAA